MRKLLPLLLIIPAAEIYILVKANETFGFTKTIGLVLLTAIAGIYLAKSEGLQVYRNINMDLSQGRVPGDNILSGLCILIGGFLLLLPGFLTDIIGITMVFPVTRGFYVSIIKLKIENLIRKGYRRIRIR